MRNKFCVVVLLLLGVAYGDAVAQTRTITGRVTDQATGAPLSGASIEALGTAAGTLAGADGSFSLQASPGEVTLRVTLIGYQRADVVVPAGRNAVEITLGVDVLNLEEIVVTGQATGISRRNLANAVATVSAEQLNVAPSASVEAQLAAKVAGADIQSNSGAPGGGNQINLRGVATIIGDATPLYVVDGVIVSDATIQSSANSVTGAGGGMFDSNQDNGANRIADLNPADIARIEVLKGGSAAAIYGSKAANGVILITTKRGQPGETNYTFSQRFGVSRLSRKLGRRVFTDSATAVDAHGSAAAPYFANGNIPETRDFEEELAGGNAPARETSLSISGGTEDTRYFVSGLVRDEEGIVTGTYYDKYSLRLNLDQTIADRLSLNFSTSATHTKTGRGFTNNDNTSTTYYVAFTGTPSFADLRPDANGVFPENDFADSNPLATAALARNDESVYRFIGSLRATYDALNEGAHNLRFVLNGGTDYFSQENVVYTPEGLQFELLNDFPGTSVLSNSHNTLLNVGVNAVHTFQPASGRLQAITSVGLNYQYADQDVARNLTQGLFAGQQNIGQGTFFGLDQTRSRTKELGLFAQEEVLIADRLLLTLGGLAERSSNNSLTDEWFYYPKAAASYNFEVPLDFVDDLKLRGAWGQAGNRPQYGDKFNTLNPGSIAGLPTLLLGSTTVAEDLHPERQTEIEGGVDVTFLDSRGHIELTGYHRRIDDLLLNRALPPSTGYNRALFNSGGLMTTDGFEALLRAVPVQGDAFDWTSQVTFSRDRTVMDSLDVPPFNVSGGGFGTSLGAARIEQGKSVTQIVGRDTARVVDDPRCLEALGVAAGSGECAVGTRFVTQIGDANPDFRMGFFNQFRYKSLTLTSTIDWQRGGDIVNLTGYLLDANQNSADFDDPCDRADCEAGETMGEYRLRVYPGRTSTTWLEDGSFVKLREVALTVDVSPTVLPASIGGGIEWLQLTLSGRNLLTITDYSGFDPEVNNFGSQAVRANIDVAPYPPSRSFWLSVDVGF